MERHNFVAGGVKAVINNVEYSFGSFYHGNQTKEDSCGRFVKEVEYIEVTSKWIYDEIDKSLQFHTIPFMFTCYRPEKDKTEATPYQRVELYRIQHVYSFIRDTEEDGLGVVVYRFILDTNFTTSSFREGRRCSNKSSVLRGIIHGRI